MKDQNQTSNPYSHILNLPDNSIIHLSNKNIVDVKPLLKVLSNSLCPNNLHIDLSENLITPEGAKYFANYLSTPKGKLTVKKLNLDDNPLRESGITALIEVSRSNLYTTISVLNAESNDRRSGYCNQYMDLLHTRNALIEKYPEFIESIKRACKKIGIYDGPVDNYADTAKTSIKNSENKNSFFSLDVSQRYADFFKKLIAFEKIFCEKYIIRTVDYVTFSIENNNTHLYKY